MRPANASSSAAVAPGSVVRARLWRDDVPTLPCRVPRPKPADWTSQAALSLTSPSPAGQLGQPSTACAAGTIGLVKKEPALRLSGSAGSRTMPLPRRSSMTASRTSASGALLAELDAEPPRELGVTDRAGELPRVQRERDVEDDEAGGVALEPAVAVGEAALLRGERALGLLARGRTRGRR